MDNQPPKFRAIITAARMSASRLHAFPYLLQLRTTSYFLIRLDGRLPPLSKALDYNRAPQAARSAKKEDSQSGELFLLFTLTRRRS